MADRDLLSPAKREQQPSIELVSVRHAELGNTPDDAIHSGASAAAATTLEVAAARRAPIRRFRFPWGRASCAVFMLVSSIAIGISAGVMQSLAAGVVSILLFLPGSYMTWAYLQVWRGNADYVRDRWLGLEPLDVDEDLNHV